MKFKNKKGTFGIGFAYGCIGFEYMPQGKVVYGWPKYGFVVGYWSTGFRCKVAFKYKPIINIGT